MQIALSLNRQLRIAGLSCKIQSDVTVRLSRQGHGNFPERNSRFIERQAGIGGADLSLEYPRLKDATDFHTAVKAALCIADTGCEIAQKTDVRYADAGSGVEGMVEDVLIGTADGPMHQ